LSPLPEERIAVVERGFRDASAWRPLREPLFRSLWMAGVVSNIGTWMQNVGGAWFMTSLSTSPMMVALMQTATTLPIMLLGLPAGALADIVDRRRLLLASQLWMFAAATALAGLTFTGAITAWWLLGLTFVLGLGNAVATPVWQAITPEIVSRERLAEAVGLASVSVNIARAVGPALGGVILFAAGPGWVFLLNALSFLGVIVTVYRWRRAADEVTLPPERIPEAVWTGWQYVRFSEPLRAVMIRAAIFIAGAAALWALLPVVARERCCRGFAAATR
jgi:MFS family permease